MSEEKEKRKNVEPVRSCHICGGMEFEWGQVRQMGPYEPDTSLPYRYRKIEVRRCLECDHLQLFLAE
jgi:hypothetical protein